MSEMVERVARAIWETPLPVPGTSDSDVNPIARRPFDALGRGQRAHVMAEARAVIVAMREETSAMESAAQQAAMKATQETVAEFVLQKDAPNAVWPAIIRPRVLWHAMIDEALRDASPKSDPP